MDERSWKLESALPPAAVEEKSEFSRLFGFLHPEVAMQDIVARPSCLAPLTLAVLVAAAYMAVALPAGVKGTEAVAIEASTAVGLLVRMVVMTALLAAYAAAVGGTVKLRSLFAVVCYARVPAILITVLAIGLILLRRASGLPDGHPVNPMMTSLAVFLDIRTTPKFLYSIASSVDCVVFWVLSLTAIGLRLSSRISGGAATAGVALYWVLSTLVQAAWVSFAI